jgi:hypothetical protein
MPFFGTTPGLAEGSLPWVKSSIWTASSSDQEHISYFGFGIKRWIGGCLRMCQVLPAQGFLGNAIDENKASHNLNLTLTQCPEQLSSVTLASNRLVGDCSPKRTTGIWLDNV